MFGMSVRLALSVVPGLSIIVAVKPSVHWTMYPFACATIAHCTPGMQPSENQNLPLLCHDQKQTSRKLASSL